jgi:TorA maturation chaperone TorD
MLAAASRIDADLAVGARRLGEAFAAQTQEQLLVEYTRLFLGPTEAVARPYGSVWLEADGNLMQESTLAVESLYHEAGFEMDEGFRELPDHIAAELEFLYLLLFREAEARVRGDPDALQSIADLRKRFLERHLGRWAGPFTHAVRAGTRSAFYRELAGLTDRFIGIEAARISST